jgi:hypothetical protein
VLGATVVWSDRAFEKQMDDFIETRRWTTHRLLHHLMARGAPVQSVVRMENLDAVQGPILVLSAHLFPKDEIQKLMTYRNGPIICIGGREASLPEAQSRFEEANGFHPLTCSVYGAAKHFDVKVDNDGQAELPADIMGIEVPSSCVFELHFQKVSDSFLKGCVDVLTACSHNFRVLIGDDVIRLLPMESASGAIRLLVRNDSHIYATPRLDVGRKITQIELLTQFRLKPLVTEGSKFFMRVPPRGMTLLEIELEMKS